jgi:hypothetical protein
MTIKTILTSSMCCTLVLTSMFLPLPLHAATATSSSKVSTTPSPTPSDEGVKQDIKDRVEKIKQSTDPEVKGMIDSMKQQKFGLIGTLEKVVGSTLQVRTLKGQTRVVEVDPDATLLKNSKAIPRSDLELNSSVIIMGYINTDQTYIGRRLIITDDQLIAPSRATLLGRFQTSTTKIVTMLTRQNNEFSAKQIQIGTKTSFLNTLKNPIKRTDLLKDDPLVVVFADKEATGSATRIYSLSTRPTATTTP